MKLYNIIKQDTPKFIPRDLQNREQKGLNALYNALDKNVFDGNITLDVTKIPKGTEFSVQQINDDVNINNGDKQSVWQDLSFFTNLKYIDGFFYCQFQKNGHKFTPQYV